MHPYICDYATVAFQEILQCTEVQHTSMVLYIGIAMLQRASQEVKEAQMFREKMGHVTEWMARSQLPRHIKEKIRSYYSEVTASLSCYGARDKQTNSFCS